MFWDHSCFRIAVFVLAASVTRGQVTTRVSVDSAGGQGDSDSWAYPASISADGRWVAFASQASNLVPGDTDGVWDVFVHDRQSGMTECASVDPNGAPAGGIVSEISADGRFVAFFSSSPNIVPGTSGQCNQVFLRDRWNGTTELVSLDPNGTEGDAPSLAPEVSADGRFVVFSSSADNLVPGDTNGTDDIFLRDRQSGTTELVSVSSAGTISDGQSMNPSVSADGRLVAFASYADNLVPGGDANPSEDVFVRDRQNGTTVLASLSTGGIQGDGWSWLPYFSADGRFVAFSSLATNLVAGDTNGAWDIFVRDLQGATTERVSVSSSGTEGHGACDGGAALSADGRYVVFSSGAWNLCPGDMNGTIDVFLRDRQVGTTERVNYSSGGAEALSGRSNSPSVSSDGRYVSFESQAWNLVPWDTNGIDDVFVRDRLPGSETTAFTSLCDPGSGSVIACPCSNPPAGTGRGCDNSAATGGATLSASGNTELSADSLVFTATGEKPTALSILAQGSALVPNGMVYGQGVRCIGGTIRRLYTVSAQGGTVTVPNLPAWAWPVSVRSAQKGDVIQPGQSRWYLIFYRDPIVLGGCPATSTFNSTQTGEIAWSF